MMSNSRFGSSRASTSFVALFALTALAMPALAADPVFPPGSRVGLVPPAGMVASKTFDGFADPSRDAAILITVLPAAAYPQIDKTLDTDALKKQGVNLEKREPMQLSFGKGFLLTGRQVAVQKVALGGIGKRLYRARYRPSPGTRNHLFGSRGARSSGNTVGAPEYPRG